MNSDLEIINKWAKTWLVKFNPSTSESLLISRKVNRAVHPPLAMNSENIKEVEYHKYLDRADVYGDSCPKYSTVAKWSAEFKRW